MYGHFRELQSTWWICISVLLPRSGQDLLPARRLCDPGTPISSSMSCFSLRSVVCSFREHSIRLPSMQPVADFPQLHLHCTVKSKNCLPCLLCGRTVKSPLSWTALFHLELQGSPSWTSRYSCSCLLWIISNLVMPLMLCHGYNRINQCQQIHLGYTSHNVHTSTFPCCLSLVDGLLDSSCLRAAENYSCQVINPSLGFRYLRRATTWIPNQSTLPFALEFTTFLQSYCSVLCCLHLGHQVIFLYAHMTHCLLLRSRSSLSLKGSTGWIQLLETNFMPNSPTWHVYYLP